MSIYAKNKSISHEFRPCGDTLHDVENIVILFETKTNS